MMQNAYSGFCKTTFKNCKKNLNTQIYWCIYGYYLIEEIRLLKRVFHIADEHHNGKDKKLKFG